MKLSSVLRMVKRLELNEIADITGWVIIGPIVLTLMSILVFLLLPSYIASKLGTLRATPVSIRTTPARFYGVSLRHIAFGVICEKQPREKEKP